MGDSGEDEDKVGEGRKGERENQSQRPEGLEPGSEPLEECVQCSASDHSSPGPGEQCSGLGKTGAAQQERELNLHKCLSSGNGVQGRWGWFEAQGQKGTLPGGCRVRRRGGNDQDSC